MGTRNSGIMISGKGQVVADQLAVGPNAKATKFVADTARDPPYPQAGSSEAPIGALTTGLRDAEQIERRLLLFVHGLGGDARATWGKLPGLLVEGAAFQEPPTIGYYTFPTSLFRLPFMAKAPKIQELAAGLRSQIENRYADFNKVDLICHSLGGLIARRYLIEEVKASRSLRVKHLALLATPNNGAGLAILANLVSWRHNQISQLCRNADIIELLNEDWVRFELQKKVATKFIIGTQDRVVDRFSASAYSGNSDVETVVGRDHIDLVKPVNSDDDVLIILKRFMQL
ncbi:esterase/lipase family protein [Bosea sp. NPDC003192]|uniref:esterase/lipase family protein n=1 Tax=Bosea sp. NPDC003192 TaxID=3390551 RepID=UPI003D056968